MDDMELLKSAGLYIHDYKNNIEGFTLASILLLGKDEVILSVIPFYKTDAILRKVNLDRYDDRDDIRINLIESYDRLLSFVNKHLPYTFYLEGDIRISIRDKIFREVMDYLNLKNREYFRKEILTPLIEKNIVMLTIPDKPRSPKQRYISK